MSDTTAEMIAFVNARLDEADARATSDEQHRYVQAMRDIVLVNDDVESIYRSALASGEKAEIAAAALARWAVLCAIGFIAAARSDHRDFQAGWAP